MHSVFSTIPLTEERSAMSETKFENCPACNAKPGQLHRLGCDVERCPQCGHQLLSSLSTGGTAPCPLR
jgi:hypothetical protein